MAEKGKWPRNGGELGWNDPTLGHGSVPKVTHGSLQPNKKILSVRAVRIWAKQVKKVRTSASSSAASSACDAHNSRENEEINDTRMRKVTRKKTLDWAGATPLFRLSAAQKVRGVAPARHAGSVAKSFLYAVLTAEVDSNSESDSN